MNQTIIRGYSEPPCYNGSDDCPNRKVGCHSKCEAYKAWSAARAEQRDARWKENREYACYMEDRVTKSRRRKKP